MQQADRFFRIVFRELQLYDYLSIENYLDAPMFSLNNDKFCRQICNKYIEVYPSNYSYDEVNVLLDKLKQEIIQCFGYKEDINVTPLHLFKVYADKLFALQDYRMTVEFNNLMEWEGFATRVEPAIFQAAFLGDNEAIVQVPLQIRHNEKRLYKLLSQGAYETHMHLNGSGASWEINWGNLACCTPIYCPSKFVKSKRMKLDAIKIFKLQSIRTFLIAVEDDNAEGFPTHLFESNMECDFFSHKSKLQTIHRKFSEKTKQFESQTQCELLRERFLFSKLFAKLHRGELDQLTINLMIIYFNMMCSIRTLFVQDNIGMGFDRFQSIEKVKDCFFRHGDDEKLLESVIEKYYEEGFVEGVELRIAPKNKKTLVKKLKKIEDVNDKVFSRISKKTLSKKLKLGVIVHYIKENETSISLPCECRHATLRKKLDKQAIHVTNCFKTISTAMPQVSIIGIDAANAEITCPPEVFAPVFRRHRQELSSNNTLGFTFHVGEEFLNLSGGLRAIDDVIEFFNYTRGDRLGHAIALGTDVEKYLQIKRSFVIGTLQNIVDDYAWLHNAVKCSISNESADLLSRLDAKYQMYAQKLFKEATLKLPSIWDYQLSYSLRGDAPDSDELTNDWHINWQNDVHLKAMDSDCARELYRLYHYDQSIKERGQESISFLADETYVEAVKIAQQYVRKKVYNRGISIETNPTSNKRISHISRYEELPLLRFNSHYIKNQNENQPDIQVTINTDDSAIFQTSLGNEYSCIANALIQNGYEKEAVFDYIDYLRKLSKATTFLTNKDKIF